jgi:long-chain alkane monooxygenase
MTVPGPSANASGAAKHSPARSAHSSTGDLHMHLNVLVQCCPSPQVEGLWRHPEDRTASGYRTLDYWTTLARRLEAACIDALFFADIHGLYDVYWGSWGPAVRHAVQAPSVDPVLALSAAATATSHLGFAITYSTTYHPPYECARLFTTLDHLTGGRVAWNVVTSYIESAASNGLGAFLHHDERYDRADEYLDVVIALWEKSWDDDAVVRDVARNMFVDPDRVHEIGHDGRWFQIRGPFQCEPSPQRTPVLYQAGASDRGTTFAARHAEVVFLTLPDPASGLRHTTELRRRAEEFKRAPEEIKMLQAGFVIVGRTREEAKSKVEILERLSSADGEFTKWCGWMGFDLAGYPGEVPVAEIRTQASRSVLDFLYRFDRERTWSVADLRALVLLSRRPHRRMGWLTGTPEGLADRMEEMMSLAQIDGYNLIPCPPSSGIDDICDLLVPELQRRGMFRTAYDPGEPTLRERYFGAGHARRTWNQTEPDAARGS